MTSYQAVPSTRIPSLCQCWVPVKGHHTAKTHSL